MADKVILQIEVRSDDGKERKREYVYDLPDAASPDNAFEWLAEYLDTEARVEVFLNDFKSKLPDPSPLSVGDKINIKFSLSPDLGLYFDSKNTAMAWLEVYNLLLSSRDHLAHARTYKAVEPAHSGRPGSENDLLYKIHLRKMDEFHHAVRDIKKIEDMVLRLIFEALGASLKGIDISKAKWEESLTRTKISESLKSRDINAKLKNMPDAEYNELCDIVAAMEHKSTPQMEAFWNYRTQLEHRVPESVDYVEQFPPFESRPKPGQLVGFIGSMPTQAKRRFEDLYDTTVAVYQHYINLLERLDKLPTFRRPR